MYIKEKKVSRIVKIMEKVSPSKDEVLLVMIAEKDHPDLNELVDAMNDKGWQFIGGIFPGLLNGNEKHDEGMLVNKLPAFSKPVIIHDMTSDNIDFVNHESIVGRDENLTAFVLVDGLTSNISTFLSNLFNKLGNSVNYIGGGVGSLSLEQRPYLIANEGVLQDAAVVLITELSGKLGVKHGWEKVEGPFLATKTDKNTIKELNWENAFSVYKEIVEKDSGKTFDENNFFDIAKAYPFGISRERIECVVRDPISVSDTGELICVGEVPENSTLDILRGKKALLTDAARQAAIESKRAGMVPGHAFVFDCISRVLFLQDDFLTEINEVQKVVYEANSSLSVTGALTLGEIAAQKGYLEFLNKTIVVGLFM